MKEGFIGASALYINRLPREKYHKLGILVMILIKKIL